LCPNNVIVVGGGLPYIILGVGITSDFLYPIVSISKPNPNPNKECVFFSNQDGFNRVYDSFQTCPSEKYIVVKCNSGFN
jgi:putative ABC transport system permease protein